MTKHKRIKSLRVKQDYSRDKMTSNYNLTRIGIKVKPRKKPKSTPHYKRVKRATALGGPYTDWDYMPGYKVGQRKGGFQTIRVKQSNRGPKPHLVGKLRGKATRHSGQRSIKWGALRDEFGF